MSYGNLQNDKSQRIALESLLNGTSPALALKQDITLAADTLYPGSAEQTVVEALTGHSHRTLTSVRADGEQFYEPSGEVIWATSDTAVVEDQSTGTGAEHTLTSTYNAFKFTTSADVSFVQAIRFSVKKAGSLTDTSRLAFALYSDVAGVPTVNMSSGGEIYAGSITTSFQTLSAVCQNVSVPLSANTTYWVVITRSESGGTFVLNGAAGSGRHYSGAALGSLSDTSFVPYCALLARSAYGCHMYSPYSHAVWGVTLDGVGVRGDSRSHYGGFFQSVWDDGARGHSSYQSGLYGTSVNGNGVSGSTPSTAAYGVYGVNTAASGGYPGVYGTSTSGSGLLGNTDSTSNRAPGVRSLQGLMFGSSAVYLGHFSGVPSSNAWNLGDILFDMQPTARGGAALRKCTTAGTPGNWSVVNLDGMSADQGDADATLTYGAIASVVMFETTLTANRTVTLSTTNAVNGAKFRIVRTGLGAFTLAVGGLKTIPSATAAVVEVMYSGSAWKLIGYQLL